MNNLKPSNQTKLFGLNKYIAEFIKLYDNDRLPPKILLSGQKGLGKSTLAYHLINYILSKEEKFKYDYDKFEIDPNNHSFKLTQNRSNTNLTVIDVDSEKKTIDINQIRELINNLNKSSFNEKPRFVLIDNIEYLNKNSINALLKILEEPNKNIYFVLINNNKKVLSTLLSRCINFKINLNNNECLNVANKLLNNKLHETINNDLLHYYLTPGYIYNLIELGKKNNYDLYKLNLKELLEIIINENHFKKENSFKYMFFDLIEFYFRKINLTYNEKIDKKYSYFLEKISYTKRFNLDEETLLMEFKDSVLNG